MLRSVNGRSKQICAWVLGGCAGGGAMFGACGVAAGQGTVELTTVRVAAAPSPVVWAGAPRGDAGRLFILEQWGQVRIVDLATNTLAPAPFLSLSGLVTGAESGLLGMAFHPGCAENGYFWLYSTVPNARRAGKHAGGGGAPRGKELRVAVPRGVLDALSVVRAGRFADVPVRGVRARAGGAADERGVVLDHGWHGVPGVRDPGAGGDVLLRGLRRERGDGLERHQRVSGFVAGRAGWGVLREGVWAYRVVV